MDKRRAGEVKILLPCFAKNDVSVQSGHINQDYSKHLHQSDGS